MRGPGLAEVDLTVHDDRGTPDGARLAALDAVTAGAEVIVGPLFSKSVSAVAPVARQANLPVLAFSNDEQVAGNGVYLVSFLNQPEIDRIVGYAASQGKRRFAALVSDDAAGRRTETQFRDAAARYGGSVRAVEAYGPSATSKLEAVRRLKLKVSQGEAGGESVDALFVPGAEDTLAALGPLLRQSEITSANVKILGTGGFDFPNAGRDPTYIGAWFPSADPASVQRFTDSFVQHHGHAPPRIASLAFDAMTIAQTLASGPDRVRYAPSQLTRAQGFQGVDGLVRLLPNGASERTMAVLEVQSFGARIIEPAASSFGPTQISQQSASSRPARRIN